MTFTVTKVMVCSDCASMSANGSLGEEDPVQDGRHLEKMVDHIGPFPQFMLVMGDEENDDTFSSRACAGCGSTLAGYRHEAAILESKVVTAASLLSADDLALLDSAITGETCPQCGALFMTKGDELRHFVVVPNSGWERVCPRYALSKVGRQLGDRVTMVNEKGHHLEFTVHGLNRDGSPRMWSGGADHSPTCPCTTDPEGWNG